MRAIDTNILAYVTELITADRDFTRFTGLKINIPFAP